jgi:hypothetical protein
LKAGYKWGSGMSKETSIAFHNELNQLFINAGWEIKENRSSCPEAWKGKNNLYLHPMNASGVVQEDLIPEVEKILSTGKTFEHYHTDVYDIIYDMTDEEYTDRLNCQKDDIRRDLLEAFKTKRCNLYITNTGGVISNVKQKYYIKRLSRCMVQSSNDIEWAYVANLFNEMVDEGCFVTANTKSGIGYRTATKKEKTA